MDSDRPMTSEEELLQMKSQGKISQEEYEKLLAAMRSDPPSAAAEARGEESEFRAFRRRVLLGSLTICLVGLPASMILPLPGEVRVFVGVLSVVGIIVGSIKLRRMQRS